MPRNISFRIFYFGVMVCIASACGVTSHTKNRQERAANKLQLGIRYIEMNKLSFAKENLESAYELDSRNVEVLNALAFLHEKLNEPNQAREFYESAYNNAQEDLGVMNNYGRFLCEQGEYSKGIELLTKSSSSPLNAKPWMALTNAGRCELTQNNTDTAEALFRKALQSQMFYSPALLEMQKLSYKKGEYWAAKGFLSRYLEVAKHTPETLWYAYQTERALGNREAANELKQQLFEQFPLSSETKKIKSVRRK